MDVFISWSGPLSRDVGQTLHEWLPSFVHAVKPFISARDIQVGSQWAVNLAKSISETRFGIVCCTRDNLGSDWLNFEAGALSQKLGYQNVVPILLDLAPKDLEGRPLAQFQSITIGKDDFRRLVERLFDAAGTFLRPSQRDKTFQILWPILKQQLDEILSRALDPSENVSKTETIDRILKQTGVIANSATGSPHVEHVQPLQVQEDAPDPRLAALLEKWAVVEAALVRLNKAQRDLMKKSTPLNLIETAIVPKEQELKTLELAISVLNPNWQSTYIPEWTHDRQHDTAK